MHAYIISKKIIKKTLIFFLVTDYIDLFQRLNLRLPNLCSPTYSLPLESIAVHHRSNSNVSFCQKLYLNPLSINQSILWATTAFVICSSIQDILYSILYLVICMSIFPLHGKMFAISFILLGISVLDPWLQNLTKPSGTE